MHCHLRSYTKVAELMQSLAVSADGFMLLLLGQWSVEEAQEPALRGDLGLVLKVTVTGS